MALFDFNHYRDYLIAQMNQETLQKGGRARLARHLQCQTSFVSQVLSGKSQLSLEHALKTSEFFRHTAEESQFFMLLVQKDKAGSKELERFFQAQADAILQKRQLVKERIGVKNELGLDDQVTYYSAWWYGAIHILSALPGTQTSEAIIERLGLAPELVEKGLRFLIQRGLVKEKGGKLSIGTGRIHLGTSSPLLPRHHSNWRVKALSAIESPKGQPLHYSALFGISRVDAERIRSMMLQLLQDIEPIVEKSPEQAPFAVLMDFFEV
ncbi:DUF4423 domain-containing protein [Bdellovibrionota bacterium FG-1]